MKKLTFLFFLIGCISQLSYSQEIVFTKFELKKVYVAYNLNFVFSNQSEKTIKYLEVSYLCLNDVNEAIGDDIRLAKKFSFKSTGPFTKGKNQKHTVPNAVWKNIKIYPYPYQIDITYMDGEEKRIAIDKNNICQYFPSLTPIEIDNFEQLIQEPAKETDASPVLGTIKNEFPTNEFGACEFKIIKETILVKDQLFENARNWLSNTYNNYKDNIQIDDKETGKFVFNASKTFTVTNDLMEHQNTINYRIIIDIKDYKYRITINNFESIQNSTGHGLAKGVNTSNTYTPQSRLEYINSLEGTKATSAYSSQISLYNLEYEHIQTVIESFLNYIEVEDTF